MTDKEEFDKKVAELMLPLEDEEMEERIKKLMTEKLRVKATRGRVKTIGEYRLIARVYPNYGPEKVNYYLPYRTIPSIRNMAFTLKVKMDKELAIKRRADSVDRVKKREVAQIILEPFDEDDIEFIALCGRKIESLIGKKESLPV